MTDSKSHVKWRRSTRCGSAACVEVAMADGRYLVRDSKNPQVELSFSADEWAAFTEGIHAGDFRFH